MPCEWGPKGLGVIPVGKAYRKHVTTLSEALAEDFFGVSSYFIGFDLATEVQIVLG